MATVLLTGAGGGFGMLTAKAMIANGHRVFGTMRGTTSRNAAAAAELRALGAEVIEMDITDDASVERGVAEAERLSGGLDVVINNAGVGVLGAQEAFTADDLRRLFDVNVFGAHRVTRTAAPYLRGRGRGLVLFVSSLLGRIAIPFYGPYNASKWAVEGLAENYSIELAAHGIDVAIVEPGGYPTTFIANLIRPGDTEREASLGSGAAAAQFLHGFEQALAANPAQNPQDVADAIVGLVESAPGTREFRTIVDRMGMGSHLAGYNDHLARVTTGIFGAFGIAPMLSRRSGAYAVAEAGV